METVILEKTIIKLGTLLALGFGTAGMSIIQENLSEQDSAAIDTMIVGQAVDCIIGCASINNFVPFTEVLQAQVMAFVNQVAEIIHGVVDSFHGAAIHSGDTFLVVWKFLPEDSEKTACLAVNAAGLILAGIGRSVQLAAYRKHPGLQMRLGRSCRVNVTIGLHSGWAIEGALGSEYKVDASYVSPTVSVAENVERATDTYEAHVLLTCAVHQMLHQDMACQCRLIDRVRIKGSLTPVDLYCLDLIPCVLSIESPLALRSKWNAHKRQKAKVFLNAEKHAMLETPTDDLVERYLEHPDIMEMSSPYSIEFQEIFNMAYQNYSAGEWKTAQHFLLTALQVLGFQDGPSLALLRFMEDPYGFEAPHWWKGMHKLEEIPPKPHKDWSVRRDDFHTLCNLDSAKQSVPSSSWRRSIKSFRPSINPGSPKASKTLQVFKSRCSHYDESRPGSLIYTSTMPDELDTMSSTSGALPPGASKFSYV